MRIEDSLSFFMFVYEDAKDTVHTCLRAFYDSIGDAPISMTVINDYPGWELPERYRRITNEFPKVRVHNNLLNQGQARNWNQITRLALMEKKEWCGVIAPDTLPHPGWLKIANAASLDGKHLIGHLNFSVFKPETIRKLGWFDERHVSGGSEDLDMYIRFEEAGIPYDRFIFERERMETRRKLGNQYRDTTEKFHQFKGDVTYWLTKWRKDKSIIPNSDCIAFHPDRRERNWPEINWYTPVLDRHLCT